MKYNYDHIVCSQETLGGAPRLNGTRLEVQHVIWGLENYAEGISIYLNDFTLSTQRVQSAIEYCSKQQCETDKAKRYCHYCTKGEPTDEEEKTNSKAYWKEAIRLKKSDLFNSINHISIDGKFLQNQFLLNLKYKFPKIAKQIEDEDSIHFKLSCWAEYANQQIDRENYSEFKKIMEFFEKHISLIDSETENALYVSFLEHLDMDEQKENHNKCRRVLTADRLKEYLELRDVTK